MIESFCPRLVLVLLVACACDAAQGPTVLIPESRAVDKVSILDDAEAWQAASASEKLRIADPLIQAAPGFTSVRVVAVGEGGLTPHHVVVCTHGVTGLDFALIPGGQFMLGSPDTERGRSSSEGRTLADVREPFLLARTEATVGSWARVFTGDDVGEPESKLPVVSVSWYSAREFCTRSLLRLPTEVEWEWACRAGSNTSFWAGDNEADVERVDLVASVRTRLSGPAVVGSKASNPFGLFDMHGNVSEWCEDRFEPRFMRDESLTRSLHAEYRVIRGGSFARSSTFARSASRLWDFTHHSSNDVGFRPACSLGLQR